MPTATTAPTGLQTKNLPVAGVKVLNDEEGIVEAFVAGIGNKDSVGDIIQPGAFVDSLKNRTPKGCWSHQWEIPVSKTLEIYEVLPGDPRLPQKMQTRGVGGLYVKTQFNLETQRGREAYSDVKFFGDESEWSIGYRVEEQEYSKDLKANLLHKIDLFEYSPVLFGANPLTSTVAVKIGEQDVTFVVACEDKDLEARMAEAFKNALKGTEATTDEEKAGSTEGHEDEAAGAAAETDETVEKENSDGAEVVDEGVQPVEGDQAVDVDGSGDPVVAEGSTDPAAAEGTTPAGEEDSGGAEDVDPTGEGEKDARSVFLKELKEGSITIDQYREKIIAGSIEARLQALSDALWDDNPNAVAWAVATFESSVVYFSYDFTTGEEGYYQTSYTLDSDSGAVTLGEERTPVDVVEVVIAKAAIMNAIWTGHGAALKSLLAPLADTAVKEVVELDADVKELLDLKSGRVLSQKNLDRLKDARDAISAVIDAAGSEEPSEEKAEGSEDESDWAKKTNEAIKAVEEKIGVKDTASEENDEAKPYHIEERGDEYCVIKDDDGKEMGCHATRQEAEDQLAALYANEGDKDGEKTVTIDPQEWAELQALLNEE